MEQTDIPFVAVIGGFRGLDATEAAAAKDVGKQLGAELAKSNFGLVVYFSDDASLEPHVVTGYAGALKQDRPGAIRVRYAESQKGKVAFAEQQQPRFQKLFTPRLFPSQVGRRRFIGRSRKKMGSMPCFSLRAERQLSMPDKLQSGAACQCLPSTNSEARLPRSGVVSPRPRLAMIIPLGKTPRPRTLSGS